MKDIALTGVPRGGTTLACKLLGDCQDTVALAEPIEIDCLPEDPLAATRWIRGFFERTRGDLETRGCATGKLVHGHSAANFFASPSGGRRRESMAQRQQLNFDPPPAPGFNLAIKHNAAFSALLPHLAVEISTIALIRHPLPVLASWHTVELPVAHGRLPAGERFDQALSALLVQTPDVLTRQLRILDWFFSRFASCKETLAVVKYEDVIASGGQCLFEAAGVAGASHLLEDHNSSPLYRGVDASRLAAALADYDGAWKSFYSAADDALALQRLNEWA